MLHITREANLALQYAAEFNGNLEVGGFGRVEAIEGRIVLSEIVIPPQIVESAHTDIDMQRGDLDWMMAFLAARNETFEQWRLWWHSHANMGTTPSSTDENTLAMLARHVAPWFCGLVINVKGDRTAFMCISEPYALRAEPKVTIARDDDPDIKARVDTMMAHVARKTYAPVVSRAPAPIHRPTDAPKTYVVNGKTLTHVELLQLPDEEFAAWVDAEARKVNPQVPLLPGVRNGGIPFMDW